MNKTEEDEEFERIEREIKMRKGGRPVIVGKNVKPYSVKLTQAQRIKLLQLGGPKWIREQIDQAVRKPK